MRLRQIVARPLGEELDSDVITEARGRQRVRRAGVAGAMLAAAGLLVGAFLLASGGGTNTGAPARSRPTEPLPRLTGRLLAGPTGLLIVAHGNEGPPFILNVDRHTIDGVRGLGLPLRPATSQSPVLGSLSPAPGGVMAVVQRTRSQTEFLIAPSGAARHITTLATRGGDSTLPARDADATWVLTWPRRGPCTLRLAPGTRPAVPVACGSLAADTTAGVWIATAHRWAIVDPLTGATRAQTAVTAPTYPADQLFALHGEIALESPGPDLVGASGGQGRKLGLVNLISGRRRQLTWPSYFGDIISVVPEPHGPLVAVDFGSPAYPGPAQAEDVWMLDTTTGTFTHLPGYPARVDIKFSDIAWTTDERLVIIAQGGGRTVLGLWKPGQAELRLRTVPSRDGYHFVPLVGWHDPP